MRQGSGRTGTFAALLALAVMLFASLSSAAGNLAEMRAAFDDALALGKDADAQAAGRRILEEFPDDPASLAVLRTFHEREWKWPRLRTSFAVLRKWEGDELDAMREADLRLDMIETLERMYPQEDAVKDGGTLYEKAYAVLRAGRAEDAIKYSKIYLARFDGSSTADKMKVLILAEALLAKDPPDAAGARKVLQAVAADEKSRYRERATKRLDEMAAGARWIDLADGCPRAEGMGRTVLLTDLPPGDSLLEAVESWRVARDAEVVRFPPGHPAGAAAELRKRGPEFVAILVRTRALDMNFHAEVLRLCRDLDGDPMPDFHFGYLAARDAKDLRALAERSAAAGPRKEPKFSMVGAPGRAADVAALDGFLHFGHGNPYGVDGGIQAGDLPAGCLPRAPLVLAGACFNGVVARSWHPCAMQPRFSAPVEVKPEEALSLAWIRAGAVAFVGAMEGDRGEMAGAEWAWLRETACPLGEVTGLSYRLAFTSLPETFAGLPEQKAGAARSQALYDVMLRGQLSRVLLGDPSVRLLGEPIDPPASKSSVRRDEAGRIVVEAEATADSLLGEAQFLSANTLTSTGMAGNGFTERRLFARVELLAELAGRLGSPEVRVEAEGKPVAVKRTCIRHEVWGGRRFVCVQLESGDGALSRAGTKAAFAFPVIR